MSTPWAGGLVGTQTEEAQMPDLSLFAYDTAAPLALTVVAEREQDGAQVQEVAFRSPLGGRVSATLIVPPGGPPQVGLIFGHWGQGDRGEFVDEAVVLARLGVGALCLDAPFRRPLDYDAAEDPAAADRQWVVDVRRGVDLLQERFALSPPHLGYVGHSLGASLGGVVAGVEQRFTAYVLMAGSAAATEMLRTSNHPMIAGAREQTPPATWEAMLVAEAPYDAGPYIGHAAPAALFFQFARHDDFVPVPEGARYFALASEPKQIAWYDDCNHELSAQARVDRAIFLCARLGLPPPAPAILDRLGQIPPPVPG